MATAISNHFIHALATGIDLTNHVQARLLMSNNSAIADLADADTVSAITTLDECDGSGYAAVSMYLGSYRNNSADVAYAGAYDSGLTNPVTELRFSGVGASTRAVSGCLLCTDSSHATHPNLPIGYFELLATGTNNVTTITPDGEDIAINVDVSTVGGIIRLQHTGAVTSNTFLRKLLQGGFDLTDNLEVVLLMSNTTLMTEAADSDDISDVGTLDEMNGANYVRKPLYLKSVENDASNRCDLKSFNAALDTAVTQIAWTSLGAGTRSVSGFAVISGSGHADPDVIVLAKSFGVSVAANGNTYKLALSASGVAQLSKA